MRNVPHRASDYYAFGSQMPARNFVSANYRYGFNGKENDNEVKGTGNSYDYGMRIYDPRIGKFLSTDPLQKNYAFWSPYQFSGNSPIKFSDLDGLEITVKGTDKMQEAFVNMLSERTGLYLQKDVNGVLSALSIPKNTGLVDKTGMKFELEPVISQTNGKFTSEVLRNTTLRVMKGGADVKPVTIIPTGQSKTVLFDEYSSNKLDLGDFENIKDAPLFQAALIGHILDERATKTNDYGTAHNNGLNTEGNIIREVFPNARNASQNTNDVNADLGRIPTGNTNPNEVYGKTSDYGEVKYKTIVEFNPSAQPNVETNKVRGVEEVKKTP